MGRSVSTHRHAVATVFLHLEFEDDGAWEWDDFVEDLQDNVLQDRYPSLRKCDRWMDREDHVILENSQVEVSVSEYCGCVAICLAPKIGDYCNDAWNKAQAGRMADNFEKYVQKMFKSCAMAKMGTFSNGESFYQRL